MLGDFFTRSSDIRIVLMHAKSSLKTIGIEALLLDVGYKEESPYKPEELTSGPNS